MCTGGTDRQIMRKESQGWSLDITVPGFIVFTNFINYHCITYVLLSIIVIYCTVHLAFYCSFRRLHLLFLFFIVSDICVCVFIMYTCL